VRETIEFRPCGACGAATNCRKTSNGATSGAQWQPKQRQAQECRWSRAATTSMSGRLS